MNRNLTRIILVIVTLFSLKLPAVAQPSTAEPSAASNARAEYDQTLLAWKELLKEMADLQRRFQIADERDLYSIRDEFLGKQQQGSQLLDQVRLKGLALFSEAPDQDQELTQFLIALAQDDNEHDRYRRAYETAKVLIENNTKEKTILDIGANAAFAIHQFTDAESWMDQAVTAGTLDLSKEHLSYIKEIPAIWQHELTQREAEAAADNLPHVKLQTTQGDIVLELFENEAPATVGNFVNLVEKQFYDGLPFHRVLPGFMAQTGCPRGDGTGGPGYNIYCECFQENHRNHFRGSLSMAKQSPPNTAGSQFFLTFQPTPHLNGKHTVFGRVIDGLDVLAKIQRKNPNEAAQASVIPDRIVKATVLRKRDHAYVPEKVSPQ